MVNFPSLPVDAIHRTMARTISESLRGLVGGVPFSKEFRRRDQVEAHARAEMLTNEASLKAAMIGGGMAIVPGPFGILTIIPALVQLWQIQRQMVADIAACYGRTPQLSQEMMVYCLFRHGAANVLADTVVQVGGRLLAKRASVQFTQQFLSRWVPLLGSAAIAAFTYRDTMKVARTAISSFERDFVQDLPAFIPYTEALPAIKN